MQTAATTSAIAKAISTLVLFCAWLAPSLHGQEVNWEVFKSGTVQEVLAEVAKLPKDTKLETQDANEFTPLMLAADSNTNADVITALLEAGADVNVRTEDGVTPLMFAAFNTNADVITALVKAGADVNVQTENGSTPLIFAAEHNSNAAVITALVKAGADVNVRTENGSTPLIFAAEHNSNAAVITALVKAGADVNVRTENGWAPLMLAASYTNADVITALLEAGADVNVRTEYGETPLMFAASNTNADVITALLEAGADVNVRTEDGVTPLMFAAFNTNADVITALVKAGADVNVQTENGWTPLMLAASYTNADVITALVKAGADVNVRTEYGETPLMFAASNTNADVITALLEAGADAVRLTGFRADHHDVLSVNYLKSMPDGRQDFDFALDRQPEERLWKGKVLRYDRVLDENGKEGDPQLIIEVLEKVEQSVLDQTLRAAEGDENGWAMARVALVDSHGHRVRESALAAGVGIPFVHANSGSRVLLAAVEDEEQAYAKLAEVPSERWGILQRASADSSHKYHDIVPGLSFEEELPDGTYSVEVLDAQPFLQVQEVNAPEIVPAPLDREVEFIESRNPAVQLRIVAPDGEVETRWVLAADTGNSLPVKFGQLRYGLIWDDWASPARQRYLLMMSAAGGLWWGEVGQPDSLREVNEGAQFALGSDGAGFDGGPAEHVELLQALPNASVSPEYLPKAGVDFFDTSPAAVRLGITTPGPEGPMTEEVWLRTKQGRQREVLRYTAANGELREVVLLFREQAEQLPIEWPSRLQILAEDPSTKSWAPVDENTVHARTEYGETPLMRAASNTNADVITALLEAGADVNVRTEDGVTPLMFAAFNTNADVITALVKAGADVNVQTENGSTPLIFAAEHNSNAAVITALVKAGADVNVRTENGWTPLMLAASYTNADDITALLEAGADVNVRTEYGETPLMFAASNTNADVITALVKAGADVNVREKNGWTPLMFAAGNNTNAEVITALVKAGADVNARLEDGVTPLMFAAQYNDNAEVITVLLEAGANAKATDRYGKSALDYAKENSKLHNTPAYWKLNDAYYNQD